MGNMNRSNCRQLRATVALLRLFVALSSVALLALVGCTAHADPNEEAPPPANIVPGADPSLFTVDRPEQFPLAVAVARPTPFELVVSGRFSRFICRKILIISLVSGRVP